MNLRIWGELLFLVVALIVIIVAVVSSFSYTTTSTHLVVKKRRKLQPAEWVAADYTVGNETVIIVELRRPVEKGSTEFESLDKREVGRLINGQRDYDQLYYDRMQDATNRAALLNALHR